MKTIITLAALAAFAAPALAQDVTREDVRDSAKQVRKDEKKLDSAVKYGSRREVERRADNLDDSRAQLRADREAYDAGVYARPTGYVVREWAVGDTLPGAYYGETYWVEPSRYELTAVPAGEHWVRVDRDVVRIGADGTVREVRRGWFR